MDVRDDRFEWNEAKNRCNYRKHKIFFEFAILVFSNEPYLDEPDDRRDYGEVRCRAVGRARDEFVTVVYTPRGARRRIISAWLSDEGEIHEFFRAFGQINC